MATEDQNEKSFFACFAVLRGLVVQLCKYFLEVLSAEVELDGDVVFYDAQLFAALTKTFGISPHGW